MLVIAMLASAGAVALGLRADSESAPRSTDLAAADAAVERYIAGHRADLNRIMTSDQSVEEKAVAVAPLSTACQSAAGVTVIIDPEDPTTYTTRIEIPSGASPDYHDAMHRVLMRCYDVFERRAAAAADPPGPDGAWGLLELVRGCADEARIALPKLTERADVAKLPDATWSKIESCVLEEGNRIARAGR